MLRTEGLTFDEASHTYRFKGTVVPGVTTVLKPLYDHFGIPLEVLNRKRDIGVATHKACELIDDGHELDPDSIDEQVAPYVEAYRKFLDQCRPEIILNEAKGYHLVHAYGGTLDRYMRVFGKRCLVDLKTVATMVPAIGVQLAGYEGILKANDIQVDARIGLQLKPNGEFKVTEYSDPTEWGTFLSLLNIHRWKAKNHA